MSIISSASTIITTVEALVGLEPLLAKLVKDLEGAEPTVKADAVAIYEKFIAIIHGGSVTAAPASTASDVAGTV